MLTIPGTGHDAVEGGPASDFVGVAVASPDGQPDAEADVFITGGGDDQVASGAPGLIVGDVVDLGPGEDEVVFAGRAQTPGGSIDGGPGKDRLFLAYEGPFGEPDPPVPGGALVLDNRSGRATLAGAPYLAWSGLEGFDLSHLANRVTFRGSGVDEHLSLGARTATVRLGSGDDRLTTPFADPVSGRALGGPGTDRLEADVYGDADVDLPRRVRTIVDDRAGTMRLGGFEDADVIGRSVTVRGTNGANEVRALGDDLVLVEARSGPDVIRIGPHPNTQLVDGNRRLVRGGPGSDLLLGSVLPDVLVGGPGRDKAVGDRGMDRCSAEVQRSCEPGPVTQGS